MFGARSELGPRPRRRSARAPARSGWAIDPHDARRSTIQGVACLRPARRSRSIRARSRAQLREPEVAIEVELARRRARAARAYGCDLSYDYVKINADYTSLLIEARRRRRRQGRPAHATTAPAFKRALLVEALALHLAVPRQALRHQVRRRGDGEGLAQGARSATT